MIKTKALSSAAVLGMVAMLFAGCGDGDNTKTQICKPSESTCLPQGNAGQVCNADGTALVDFSCGEDETCSEGSCVAECNAGDVTCAGKFVSRVCTDAGDKWEPVPCPVGTACVEGDGCVPSDEGVEICTPGEAVCANDTTVKTCDADGAGWVYTTCAAGVACSDGECSFDAETTCTPRETACIDAKTSAICNDDGTGWTVTDCPTGAPCTDGVCQGTGCVVGATKCEEPSINNIYYGLTFRTLYTCVDGVNWEATQCGAGTICTYDNVTQPEIDSWVQDLQDWYSGQYYGNATAFPDPPDTSDSVASCKAPECDAPAAYYGLLDDVGYFDFSFYGALDVARCGDATSNAGLYDLGAFSTCVGLPPYSNLTWSVTQCKEPATCTYDYEYGPFSSSSMPTCSTVCTPGETACSNTDAIITCDENGQWGAPEECPMIEYDGEEAYQGYCVPKSPGSATVGTTAAKCMDPTCAYWEFYGFPGFYGQIEIDALGACTPDRQFRACDDDGMLGDPEPCSNGTCQTGPGPLSNAAGQSPGACLPNCIDGQTRCFPTGSAVQTCVDGEWSAELDVCDSGESCYGFYGADGSTSYVCGECSPGSSYCSGDSVFICNDEGELEETACSYGTCVQSGAFAHCEAQCLEGSVLCDSDGATTYQECVDGLLVAAACDTGETCRLNYSGQHLGCVQCVGADAGGNNQYGIADAYCNTTGQVVACGDDNEYGAPDDACDNTCVSSFTTDTPVTSVTYAYCGPEAPPASAAQ
jgi:hypothetical protein